MQKTPAVEKITEKVKLPPGYNIAWGVQFGNQQRALAHLKIILPLPVLIVTGTLFTLLLPMLHPLFAEEARHQDKDN